MSTGVRRGCSETRQDQNDLSEDSRLDMSMFTIHQDDSSKDQEPLRSIASKSPPALLTTMSPIETGSVSRVRSPDEFDCNERLETCRRSSLICHSLSGDIGLFIEHLFCFIGETVRTIDQTVL